MLNKIIDLLLNYVEPDEDITENTKIKADLGMSSFDLACFANDIQDELGVLLSAEDFRKCPTVGLLAEHIENLK